MVFFGDDDVIYQGDLDCWVKVAYVFKVCYYMYIIKWDVEVFVKVLDVIVNVF